VSRRTRPPKWTYEDLLLVATSHGGVKNDTLLSKHLGRSPGAIAWARRFLEEGAEIGPRGSKHLAELARKVKREIKREVRRASRSA
jgi:hypothetical protein